MDFVHDPILNFSNFLLVSFIFSSSCKIASWDTPPTQKINFEMWHSLKQLKIPYKSHCTSPVICCLASDIFCPRLALPHKSPCTLTTSTHIAYCYKCQFAFSVTFGAGRGYESLSNSIRSPIWENSVDAICWHRTVYDDCMWPRLPELQSLILCSG